MSEVRAGRRQGRETEKGNVEVFLEEHPRQWFIFLGNSLFSRQMRLSGLARGGKAVRNDGSAGLGLLAFSMRPMIRHIGRVRKAINLGLAGPGSHSAALDGLVRFSAR